MSHMRTIRIRGYHCDFYGHLNHARYLELMEEARWSYLEDSLDLADWKEKNLGIVVAALTIQYLRPVPVDTLLEIHSEMGDMGAKTGIINQVLINGGSGKRVAEAAVTFAVVNTRTGLAVPLEGEVRQVFEAQGSGKGSSGL
jgi:thioesterase-3